MNKQRKTSHILNIFQYDHATGIIGLNGAPVSGYGLYLTTNINDGSVGIDSSASINALYLLKNTTKQFEISYDTSGATKIFRLLPYQSGSSFQIGNPSNAANSNTDYVFISESVYGNVLIGPGIGNAVTNLTGATAATHKIQFNGAIFANNSIQATSFVITGGASTGFLKADGTVDAVTYLSGNQSITVSGDATGSGTTSITLTLANTAVTPGTYGSTTLVPVVTVDSKGRVTNVTTAAISGSLTFTGDVTGTGTTGTSTGLTLAASGVTAGTYTKVTVDSKGRVTVGANASTTDISEGTNLYYTDTRVGTYLTANSYATQSYVGTQVANLVAAAPATLDTLNELAAALGNDPNFATSVATSIGTKQAQLNGTGFVKISGTTISYDNSIYALDSAVVKLAVTQTITGAKTFTQRITTDEGLILKDLGSATYITPSSGYGGISYNNTVAGYSRYYFSENNGSTSILNFPTTVSSKVYTYPNASGILALTSDIPTNNNQLTNGAGYLTSVTTITGNAGTVTNGVYTIGDQTIGGTKSFSANIINSATADWYMYGFGARGASSGQYGIGLGSDIVNRTLSFHVPNLAAYSSSGNIPKFGWYSNGALELMSLQSATGNLIVYGTIGASNFSGTHSGSSSGTNTGDQTNISGTAASETLATVTARGATTSQVLTLSSTANSYSGHHYFIAYDAAGNHYPHYQNGSSNVGAIVNTRVYTGSGGSWRLFVLNGQTAAISWDGNTIYHSGNIPTWNQNTTGTAAYATQWGTAAGYANFSSTAISASVGWLFGTTGNGTYAPVSLASVATLLSLGSLAYSSATIPTNNNQLTNGAGYITSYTETDTLSSVVGRGASTSTGITINPNGTSITMGGGSSAEGIRMQASTSTTYPVFLRSVNPAGGGETSPWLYKEESTPWGIWHNNPINTFDFTSAGSGGIAQNVGGGTNQVMVRIDPGAGYVQTAAGFKNSAGTVTLDNSGNISGNAATATYATSAGSAPNASNANTYYNVTPGNGYGLKFWSSDAYKISMGASALYYYGPVTDYSIKMQMDDGSAGRGFTWGRESYAPIAGLNATSGNMQIAGTFTASNFSGSSSGSNTGDQTSVSGNAGTVTNGVYTTGDQTIGGVKTFGKRTYFGSSSGWDDGSLSGENGNITNVHFQGHADFWIGAGNSTWYTTATAGQHDLIINTMQAQSSYDRGISFTASFSGTSGYRLGKWYAATTAATSYLSISGGLTVGGTTTLTSIKGAAQTVPNTYGAYLHLGDWAVGRTATGAVLVNTAYRADYATDLFDMNISRFTNNSGYITSSGILITIQDTAPAGVAGKLWWESDTGKLKVYYGSAWVDASPIPDSSLFFAKAGGSITGDVTIGQTLNVVGNTLVQGTISAFGDVIAYSSSDSRLKDNITVIESPLEKVCKINGVSFNWNDKQSAYEVGKKDIGVIAQEVEEVLPELVTTRDNGYKAVRYEKIVALLIEAVKEQQTQINNLTDKLNNL